MLFFKNHSFLECSGQLKTRYFPVLFTDSALSFSAFFNDVVPISSGGKALILASNVSLALKLRDRGEKRRLYQRQWSTTEADITHAAYLIDALKAFNCLIEVNEAALMAT